MTQRVTRWTICSGLVLAGAALVALLLLTDVPGASAATRVPTATATPVMLIPTSMYSMTAPMSAELDAGFWDYDQYDKTMSAAWSWYEVANRYHIIELFAVFAIAALVISMIGRMVISHFKQE